MDRRTFTITDNKLVANKTYRLQLNAENFDSRNQIPTTFQDSSRPSDDQLILRAGQFVDIALPGFYLRRPIAVCDFSAEGSLTLYYKVVGEGTSLLSTMQRGDKLDLLIGLGNGYKPEKCANSALLVAGGLGAAPLHLLCKELVAMGKKVSLILCFNTASDIILLDEYKSMGVEPVIATVDGSAGAKGFALDALARLTGETDVQSISAAASRLFDYFYTCGPLLMMKSICEALDLPGEASLEERMGCGGGYCYGCTCHTVSGAKRVCKDGPVFDKEEIEW